MPAPRVTDRVIQRIADRKIEAAMAEGKFDNLSGRGQPLPNVDKPYDPTRWVRDWLRRNHVQLEPRSPRS